MPCCGITPIFALYLHLWFFECYLQGVSSKITQSLNSTFIVLVFLLIIWIHWPCCLAIIVCLNKWCNKYLVLWLLVKFFFNCSFPFPLMPFIWPWNCESCWISLCFNGNDYGTIESAGIDSSYGSSLIDFILGLFRISHLKFAYFLTLVVQLTCFFCLLDSQFSL